MGRSHKQRVSEAAKLKRKYKVNITQAANITHVLRSTVGHRLAGRPAEWHHPGQLLKLPEELVIVQLITDLQRQYQCPSHELVRSYARLFLAARGKPNHKIGKNFVFNFYKRNDLGSQHSQSISLERL